MTSAPNDRTDGPPTRHVAILEFLRDAGPAFARSAEAFELDAGLQREGVPRATGLLEKKWTSVVRLQKKVLELEERLAHAEEELKAARVGGGDAAGGLLLGRSLRRAGGEAGARNLPRAPAVRMLVGHRGGITCLATHPVYGLLVSGSEDASIKTWDLESGEYERTLKGHTNAVQAVAFNRSGSLLASCSSDLSIKLWDFGPNSSAGKECLRTLRGHDHNISGLVFLPQGDQLVSCSRSVRSRRGRKDSTRQEKTSTFMAVAIETNPTQHPASHPPPTTGTRRSRCGRPPRASASRP